jgi:O-antigen/teichoic acid export membrane protein
MPADTPSSAENRSPRDRRRQGALWGVLLMLGSSYADLLLGLVQSIYVMNRIGPTGRGLMRLADMFNKYLSNAHLGALHGLSKQLPLALGRHDEARAQELEDVGMTTVLGLGFLGSLAMLIWALWGPAMALPTRQVLAVGAGLVWCGHAFSVYRIVLRAWGTYSVLALASLVTTLSEFALVIGGARFWGVQGAMLGWLGANLTQLLYLHFAAKLRIHPRWDWAMLRYMICAGLPLASVVFADVLLLTIDGVIVIKYLSAYNLGLYSLAMQISGYVKKIPEAAGFVLMPRIWEKYAAEDSQTGPLRDQVLSPTLAAATVMPVISGLLFILTPNLIAAVVPKFTPGAYAAQVLCMGGAFLALPLAANGLLIAMNRDLLVSLTKLAGAAVIAAGAAWTLGHHGSLAQVAMFAVAGYAVSSVLTLSAALGHYYPEPWCLIRELALCHFPFIWAIGAIKGAGLLTAMLLGPDRHSWPEVIVRMFLFLALCAPTIWYGNHRTRVLSRLRLLLREKIRGGGTEQRM